jgi:hypothetical protein
MQKVYALVAAVVLGALVLASGGGAANDHASAAAVCPAPPEDAAHCHALVETDAHGNPQASTSPTGLAPATIKSVYGYATSSTAGSGKTIAIVDAYDDPSAESDLARFSSTYGLPACTTANGCFRKVDQNGGARYPRADAPQPHRDEHRAPARPGRRGVACGGVGYSGRHTTLGHQALLAAV